MFQRIPAYTRISFTLASLALSVCLLAQYLNLVPDPTPERLAGRKALSEAVAIQCCLAAQREDATTMRTVIEALVARNPDITSAALRKADGKVLAAAGPHVDQWDPEDVNRGTGQQVVVPILAGRQRWGGLEIRFRTAHANPWYNWHENTALRLGIFLTGGVFLAYNFFLKRVLRHLDPTSVIPDRVRRTLNTLAEGVLVFDRDQRIVLANEAFARNVGRRPEELQGKRQIDLDWTDPRSDKTPADFPWQRSLSHGASQTGVMLRLNSRFQRARTFSINSAPIIGEDGKQRGALATFDDVTSIEEQNLQLAQMLQVVQRSKDEIHQKNQELQFLATRDPLTGCFNRRAFFSEFERLWKTASDTARPLNCLMMDIDHFKSVNDNHGHAKGDEVLQQVAAVLKTSVREDELICRYGGEEFCVVMPDLQPARALERAEAIRSAVESQPCGNLRITISLGTSAIIYGAKQPAELLDQADKALYFSKRNGRNRVTSYVDLPADFTVAKAGVKSHKAAEPEVEIPIPFHAVTALCQALAYRDAATAEHSRRVADLCVATASGVLNQRASYVLEVAALLHDIGKLGVPDAILLKPGPLTDDEWRIMSKHDRISAEIISAAFSCPELTEIVRTHHAFFGGQARDPGLPQGEAIPLGARILTIADAYDAMVSDRVYRRGRERDAAFAELRRCAGAQFDPVLVERFILAVSADNGSRQVAALSVSKQTALRIGMQIERLAEALDKHDFTNLAAMASRLVETATKDGVPEIAERARALEAQTAGDPDLLAVLQTTTELLELCRATQNFHLSQPDPDDTVAT